MRAEACGDWTCEEAHKLNAARSPDIQLAAEQQDENMGSAAHNPVHDPDLTEVIARSGLFDSDWYLAQNPDVAAETIDPLTHYLTYGAFEGRDPSPHFDSDWYLTQNPDVAARKINPLMHYLTYGGFEGRDPSPHFDSDWYLLEHPDVAAAKINPLIHYLLHGTAEVRSRPVDLSGWQRLVRDLRVREQVNHRITHAGKKPKIVFVTHEASRTGAPLILLTLLSHFAKSHRYELYTFVASPPLDLLADFQRYSCVISGNLFGTDDKSIGVLLSSLPGDRPLLAICNTANTYGFAAVFRQLKIPVISLIHEMLYSYPAAIIHKIYTNSDKIIFPAEFVESVADTLVSIPPGKSVVIPQGLLDPKFRRFSRNEAQRQLRRELSLPPESLIVLGCGTLEIRKGIDFFVSLASVLSRSALPIHFVWLGSLRDQALTYWVEKDVEKFGLTERVHLIGERDDPALYFCAADIFVLTSREDPFPCVVHEAMAAELAVIAFEDAGGASEAIGSTGVVVKYGDVAGMAAEVERLLKDDGAREKLRSAARQRVESEYRFDDYFRKIARLASAELNVPLAAADLQPLDPDRPRVFFFNRDWWISGVNSVTETLILHLNAVGVDAEVIFPEFPDGDTAYLPSIPHRFLNLNGMSLKEQWSELVGFAEANAPCILLPNYDYLTSAISPALSDDVAVIGVIHSDDVEHYDHAYRLGRYWNRIVCSSEYLSRRITELNPSFADRINIIPYGIAVPSPETVTCQKNRRVATSKNTKETITLVYCGRLMQHQKRVLDLVKITNNLDRNDISYRLTVIGEGSDLQTLKTAWTDEIKADKVIMLGRLSRREMLTVLEQNNVFVLVSDFEGMPISLLEAMAHGCVPVVSDLASGIPDLVIDGVTGFRVPVGDVELFASYIERLYKDRSLMGRMATAAHEHLYNNGFRDIDMGEKYREIIVEVWGEITRGAYTRPAPILWRSPAEKISPPGFALRLAD